MLEAIMNKRNGNWKPEIQLYVAEYGQSNKELLGRLAFHTFEEAEDWIKENTTCPEDTDLEEERTSLWTWEGKFGMWAEIRKVRVTQPRRLLRDEWD